MKMFLNKIRTPSKRGSMKSKILVCVLIALLGLALGVFQKWLDNTAVNELPSIFGILDIGNFFGRFSIWILLATAISVYSATALKAAINTFLFFISMVSGYYLYCNFVVGFLPVSYMMIWIGYSFASFFLAYICWYAKGKGAIAIIISSAVLGALLSQAVILTQGIYITYVPEVITFLIGVVILFRKPKEFVIEILLSIVFAVVFQLFNPFCII